MPDVKYYKGKFRSAMFSCTDRGAVWMIANFLHCQFNSGVAAASFDNEHVEDIIKQFIDDGISVEEVSVL